MKFAVSVIAEFIVIVWLAPVPVKLPVLVPVQDLNLWPALGVAVIVTFWPALYHPYGHSILESECRKAINAVGLEPSVGFLHDFADYQTKESLVYDLQESFCWLIDMSVLHAFESKMLGSRDFYFTGDDYQYRFELEAKRRFIQLLREKFNVGVAYKGRRMKWDTVILEKTGELARYLSGRSRSLDFCEPVPILERTDNRLIREKILSLTQAEAKKRGIGKSTLHYLRKNARKPEFAIYKPVMTRLSS